MAIESVRGGTHGHGHPHHHAHDSVPEGDPFRVLAIDVGAGTQDILLYDSSRTPENCFKLVLPSQTQVVANRIKAATSAGKAVHLTGKVMGGGASTEAVDRHLQSGLNVSATTAAAATIHNDLDRVKARGIEICDEAPAGATIVELRDVDLESIAHALAPFGIDLPEVVAVAVQDHGYQPGRGNNEVRFAYLQRLVDGGGDLANAVFTEPPSGMTRMAAVRDQVPGAYLMDTGMAAVLGALGDPEVAREVAQSGAILVNVGNMHTFATLVRDRRLYGLFELHTGGITPEVVGELIGRLQAGTIDGDRFTQEFDGHGAALDPSYRSRGPISFVTVTGPNRHLIRSLGYHEAAPHGDMMLTGSFGLVEGVFLAMAVAGNDTGRTLVATIPK